MSGRPILTTVFGKIVARTLLIVTVVALTLVLAEVGVRIWKPVPDDRLVPFAYNGQRVERIADEDTYIQFDRELGWIIPRATTKRDDGMVFRTNRARMRADREFPTEPPEGRLRIAAFGDSFTHCNEVSQKDCWATRLEEAWPNTEVLNFGVPGYGPDQAWLRYQRDGRQYRPCIVFIGFFVEDIDRVVNRFRPFTDPDDSVMLSKPRFMLEGDGLRLLPNPTTDPRQMADPVHVERTLGPDDAWYFPGTFVPGPFDGFSLVRLAKTAGYQRTRTALSRTPLTYPLYDQQGEAYQITGRILIQFAEQVKADGAAPVVIVFPSKRDLLARQVQPSAHQPLVDWLQQAGVPTLDFTDEFVLESSKQGMETLFAAGSHFSPLGNSIVAARLAQAVPGLVAPTCKTP